MEPIIYPLLSIGIFIIVFRVLRKKQSKPIRSANPVPYSSGYSSRSAFSYSVLRAEDPKHKETDMGEVTKEGFLTAFEVFPWDEQIQKANELQRQSPTLTIMDNQRKQALAISMTEELGNKGYMVELIFRDTTGADMLTFKLTKNKQAVMAVIEKFFDRSPDTEIVFQGLDNTKPDPVEQLQEALKDQPSITTAEKYSARHILKEILYSFILSILPALVLFVIYVINHEDATGSAVGWVGLGLLTIGTIAIYIFRQVVSRKTLKNIALSFLGLIFLFSFIGYMSSGIICHQQKGSWGYYRYSHGVLQDIDGGRVSKIGRRGFLLDTVCYISEETAKTLRGNKDDRFFYSFVTFVVRN